MSKNVIHYNPPLQSGSTHLAHVRWTEHTAVVRERDLMRIQTIRCCADCGAQWVIREQVLSKPT